MRLLMFGVAVGTLLGCASEPIDSSAIDLRIFPSSDVVAPGNTQDIVLWNQSSAVLTENLCPVTLQQREGSTWKEAFTDPGPGIACPDYARWFPPGRVIHRSIAVPSTVPAGQYRVVF